MLGTRKLTIGSLFFNSGPYILEVEGWVEARYCIWKGPDFLLNKLVLEPCYSGDSYLESFFAVTLGIKDSTFETVLDELMYRTQNFNGSTELFVALKMYHYLDAHVQADGDLVKVR